MDGLPLAGSVSHSAAIGRLPEKDPGERVAVEIRVEGVVQGVGFRPFVHRIALRHEVAGWVRNEAGAVRIVAEGDRNDVTAFEGALQSEAPPLARIDAFEVREEPAAERAGFEVVSSELVPGGRLPVSPDVALCEACAAELRDPDDRRYLYPFITCTDCGPRFTVIESMPYDRERSTMAAFAQCPACLKEYQDPTDRRYHSETNSCHRCGPRVWLEHEDQIREGWEAIERAASLLRAGGLVAIRGLGGFHLAAAARSGDALERLRRRKLRDAKPLAVMVGSVAEARELARVNAEEEALLTSRERPIVVLERLPGAPLAEGVAPGLASVGVMLAYTPLHVLLLEQVDGPLVMTSGNRSDEPIATGNHEGRERLGAIADAFLLHDREIVSRYDDSLVRQAVTGRVFLRRARGYAPLPLDLPVPTPAPFLAVGPHLKNTFTVAHGNRAWVSQHIGDLENVETLAHFHDALHRFEALFRLEPEAVVRDLHPGYLSTRIAEESGLPELPPVQHHHAHVAAVQAEWGVREPVLGLAFDGTGYGDDGRVWGCEILRSDLVGYERRARLRYSPLPGGDRAVRAPWRVALGYASLEADLEGAFSMAFEGVDPAELEVARQQIRQGVNSPEASSLGRLFDAASAVLGVRREARYEGQAPMELEALAGRRSADPLPFPWVESDGLRVMDPLPLLAALATLRRKGHSVEELAARFHVTISSTAAGLAAELCRTEGLSTVALGGGCFQNTRLLDETAKGLEARGIRVLVPRLLGPNDGAVSYGQAVVAAARWAAARS